eukprot:359690-Chlamydomonas_euryale.AAC.1
MTANPRSSSPLTVPHSAARCPAPQPTRRHSATLPHDAIVQHSHTTPQCNTPTRRHSATLPHDATVPHSHTTPQCYTPRTPTVTIRTGAAQRVRDTCPARARWAARDARRRAVPPGVDGPKGAEEDGVAALPGVDEGCRERGTAHTRPRVIRVMRGGALCHQASLINHECNPNVARFDDFDSDPAAAAAAAGAAPAAGCMVFRAMHDLPVGTELTQSYMPLHWSFEERQAQTRGVYGFACACARCQAECEGLADVLGVASDLDMSDDEAAAVPTCCGTGGCGADSGAGCSVPAAAAGDATVGDLYTLPPNPEEQPLEPTCGDVHTPAERVGAFTFLDVGGTGVHAWRDQRCRRGLGTGRRGEGGRRWGQARGSSIRRNTQPMRPRNMHEHSHAVTITDTLAVPDTQTSNYLPVIVSYSKDHHSAGLGTTQQHSPATCHF